MTSCPDCPRYFVTRRKECCIDQAKREAYEKQWVNERPSPVTLSLNRAQRRRDAKRARQQMKVQMAKPEHEVAYQDLSQLLSKHAGKMTSLELLAIAANMLGKLVALQDQRSVTPKMAMEIVAKNIEAGNQQMLDQLGQSKGHG